MRVGYSVKTDIMNGVGAGCWGLTSEPCGPSDAELGTVDGLVGRWGLGGEVGRSGGVWVLGVGGGLIIEVLEHVFMVVVRVRLGGG